LFLSSSVYITSYVIETRLSISSDADCESNLLTYEKGHQGSNPSDHHFVD